MFGKIISQSKGNKSKDCLALRTKFIIYSDFFHGFGPPLGTINLMDWSLSIRFGIGFGIDSASIFYATCELYILIKYIIIFY